MVLAAQQAINKIIQSNNFDMVRKNGLDQTYFHGYENSLILLMNIIIDMVKFRI